MISIAPVIVFVYNRLDHASRTIDALKENFLADQSDLLIYADAAKDDRSLAGVTEVREYLLSITGFKSVDIRLRETNFGVDENTITAVTEVIQQYGKVIVVEDDLVTSKWFLKFMNEALDYYENYEQIIAINGYTFPTYKKAKESFFLKGADCWGWATWKRGWDLFENDGKKLFDELTNRGLQREFNFDHNYSYVEALEQQAIGNTSHWDIRWYASAFLKGKLSLYPGQSLVYNIGHDGSGTHCGENHDYEVVLADAPLNVITEVKPDPEAYQAFSEFFKRLMLQTPVPKRKNWLSRSFKKFKSIFRDKF